MDGFILGPGSRIFRPPVLEFDTQLMGRGLAKFGVPNEALWLGERARRGFFATDVLDRIYKSGALAETSFLTTNGHQ